VLIAGLNRGWTVSSAVSPLKRLEFSIGSGLGYLIKFVTGRELVTLQVRRGSPFLTHLRLGWLELQRDVKQPLPIVVQLLGTIDELVSPADNIDLITGQKFYYLEVAGSDHFGIVELRATEDGGDNPTTRIRREAIRNALTMSPDQLAKIAVRPDDVDELLQLAIDDFDIETKPRTFDHVTDVLFVIHGIRDKGFWTKKIARRARICARDNGKKLRSVTSTYGYFPMFPFFLPWARRLKVEWLLDQYVEAKALYPKAEFSYVGHSNGSYLVARALEVSDDIKFKHIVFAGSVVRRKYDWRRFVDKRVRRVLNLVATRDFVVAIFPKGLEEMRLEDLGGAGHDGFHEYPNLDVRNIRYFPGGHSAALAESNWDEIAKFVVNGTTPSFTNLKPRRSFAVVLAGIVAPAIWITGVACIALVLYALLAPLGSNWIYAVLLVAFLALLQGIFMRL